MNQYRCETCKHYEKDKKSYDAYVHFCWKKNEWIIGNGMETIELVGCASHSDFQNQREKVLDELKCKIIKVRDQANNPNGWYLKPQSILEWMEELRGENG